MNFTLFYLYMNINHYPLFINNNYNIKYSFFNKFLTNCFLNYFKLFLFQTNFHNFLDTTIKLNNLYSGLYTSRPSNIISPETTVIYCEFQNCITNSIGGALSITQGIVNIKFSIFNFCQGTHGGVIFIDNTYSNISFSCVMNSIGTYDGHFIRIENNNINIELNFVSIFQSAPYFVTNSHSSTVFYSGNQYIDNCNTSYNFIKGNDILDFCYSNNPTYLFRTTIFNNSIESYNMGLLFLSPYNTMTLNYINIIKNNGINKYLFIINSLTYMSNINIFQNNLLFLNLLSHQLYISNSFLDISNPNHSSIILSTVYFNYFNIKIIPLKHLNSALCKNSLLFFSNIQKFSNYFIILFFNLIL